VAAPTTALIFRRSGSFHFMSPSPCFIEIVQKEFVWNHTNYTAGTGRILMTRPARGRGG
jgi:hypothetical protein